MTAILIVIIALLCGACGMLLYLYVNTRQAVLRLTNKLVKAEQQNNQDQDLLRQRKHLDTIKDEFISTVSHEIRTPLTSIRGALGLLSAGIMGQMDDKAGNLLRIASTNTDRLVRLINDVLDLERMDSGQVSLEVRRCSLRELVEQAVETMGSMAEAAGVEIKRPPTQNVIHMTETFEGDPDRIQQVLCNLLSNGIKFSPRGSNILMRIESDSESLMLCIEDHGRGVPTEKLETIFDRFSQVEPEDAKHKGGTGLGLAICRSILAQHGGAIWARRNDANGSGVPGTTFVLRIPRVRPVPEAETEQAPAQGAILVVDDDSLVRQLVAEQLRRHGYSVLESDRGEQAIHIAEKHYVEAILLDLYMPGLSGWETLERLKKNPDTADIPVVVLSVLSPATHTENGKHLLTSAQGWVQKPFNESLLLAELGRVLHAGTGPGRILLVEDDDVVADVVKAGFADGAENKQGITIKHVSTISDAKFACEMEPPDLMILDLTLPDGNGFALVEWLRERPTLRKLPLVVYSGREVTGVEMEQLRLGPTQFLTKAQVQPRHVEELVLAMVRTLRNPHPTLAAQTA